MANIFFETKWSHSYCRHESLRISDFVRFCYFYSSTKNVLFLCNNIWLFTMVCTVWLYIFFVILSIATWTRNLRIIKFLKFILYRWFVRHLSQKYFLQIFIPFVHKAQLLEMIYRERLWEWLQFYYDRSLSNSTILNGISQFKKM